MRMIITFSLCLSVTVLLADEPPARPALAKLQEAKNAYPATIEKVRTELLEDIDRQLVSLAKAGKLDAAADVKQARDAWVADQVLPDLPILRGVRSKYERAERSAERLLAQAYDRAVAELTRQLALDDARDLRAEKEAFLDGQLVRGLLATTTVRASLDWQTSRIRVEAGRVYEIRATGTWRGSTGIETGPRGVLEQPYADAMGDALYVKDTSKYVGLHPTGSLIVRFGAESWSFYAGDECRFLAPTSAALAFAFNDVPDGAETATGSLDVTVREVPDYSWVNPDGRMDVTGLVDTIDELIITVDGLQWHHTGGYSRVGEHLSRWPTIINGTYWWPEWPDWPKSRKSSILPLPGIEMTDITGIRDITFRGSRRDNKIAEQQRDRVILLIQKSQGFGPAANAAIWSFPPRSR